MGDCILGVSCQHLFEWPCNHLEFGSRGKKIETIVGIYLIWIYNESVVV